MWQEAFSVQTSHDFLIKELKGHPNTAGRDAPAAGNTLCPGSTLCAGELTPPWLSSLRTTSSTIHRGKCILTTLMHVGESPMEQTLRSLSPAANPTCIWHT